MFCTKCGAVLPNEGGFCTKCGAKLKVSVGTTETQAKQAINKQVFPEFEYSSNMNQQPTAQQSVNQQPASQQPIIQPSVNQQPINQQVTYQQATYQQAMAQKTVQPQNSQSAAFYSTAQNTTNYNGMSQPNSAAWQNYGTQNPSMPLNSTTTVIGNKKKSWKPRIIAIGSACAVVAIIVVIICLVLPKQNKQFYTGTIEAIGKNLDADGFEVKIVIGRDSLDAMVRFNPKKSELSMLASTNDKSDQFGIYKGTTFYVEDGIAYKEDKIDDELELFFKYYNKYINGISALSDIDLEKAMDDLIDEFDSYGSSSLLIVKNVLDFDEIKESIKKIETNLNDKEYLAENYNYTLEEADGAITHCFDLNLYDVLKVLIKEFGTEAKYLAGIDLEDAYDYYSKVEVMVESTIKDGYLTKLKITVLDKEDNDSEAVKITFSNFGSGKIDDMEDQLKDYYENMEEYGY